MLFPFSESIMFTGLLVASLFSQRYSSSLSSSSQKVVREMPVNLLSGFTQKKLSRQRCEHTDPVMLNLTATRRQIPDTSDDNFTTGFLPSLHRQDRLTFTARF